VGIGVEGAENGVNKVLAEEAGVEGTGSSRSIGRSSIEVGGDSGDPRALMVIYSAKI
jgi:hypothetical protein